MFKLIFTYLLFVHIVGDYYFQSGKLAEDKQQSFPKVMTHGLIYFIVIFVCSVPIWNRGVGFAVLFLSGSHLLIDLMKFGLIKKNYHGECPAEIQRFIYIADQFLHISCIILAAYILTIFNINLSIDPRVSYFFTVVNIHPQELLTWITLILLIWKPTNITIKQLLCLYKPTGKEAGAFEAGAFIGFLERLIILILLSINQYSAIGLVLTAKSVARYNKISDNQEFAEYYLLGTLLSTVIVIGAYRILI
jgi:hypothetical protein